MPATDRTQGPPPTKKRKKSQQPSANIIDIGGKLVPVGQYLSSETSQPNKPIAEETAKSTTDQESYATSLSSTKQLSSLTTKGKERRHEKSSSLKSSRKAYLPGNNLPIWEYRSVILEAARSRQNKVILVVGETGSGKSTQLPQFLYQEPWCKSHEVSVAGSLQKVKVGGMIAITQPRRVAATTLAHRVSQEVGTPLSNGRSSGLVGYSVRFDHVVPKGTKIKFLTEGTLLQELLRDPHLCQYSAVVVDEIHERSLDVDMLVGFLKQILDSDQSQRGNIPLRVIIMSATADINTIQRFFDGTSSSAGINSSVEVVRISGRQFPVHVFHEPQPVSDIQDSLLKKIFKIHLEEPLPGDILAFLTGQEEIESAQKLIEEYAATLASNLPKVAVQPLFGQLSIDAQRAAFDPLKTPFTRKIVLATNIAETSVTVPGVKFVVDCGKAKVKQFRPRLGMESLLAKPISKSSAVQRTGRAGREGPGKCFRLYTEASFESLTGSDLPEILRNDVLGALLTMKARGVQDVFNFPLIDTPAVETLENALLELHFLGALCDDGSISLQGQKMAKFPVSAALGAVLLAAAQPEYDCVIEVIDIISCITAGEDIFLHVQSDDSNEVVEASRKEIKRREGDLITYLTTMQQYTGENANRIQWCKNKKINIRNMKQALNIRRQLRGMCLKEKLLHEAPPADPQSFQPSSPERAETIIRCFLRGFALKTAILAPDGSYQTAQGKHIVAIHPASVLHGQKKEAIMFLDHVFTTKNYAKKVSVIQAKWIIDALESKYSLQ